MIQVIAAILMAIFGVLSAGFSIAAKVGFIVMIGTIIMAVADVVNANTMWLVVYVWLGCVLGVLVSLFIAGAAAVVATD